MATRRSILGGMAGLALAPVTRSSLAQERSAMVAVADDFVVLTGFGGNVLVRASDRAQVIVDSGAAPSADALLGTLAALPGAGRAATLFNTHWHPDQVGGNAALGRAGATIVAHEKTRWRLATDYYLPAEERYERALPAEGHPTESFFETGEKSVDGEIIEFGHLLQAHTDGDIYVFFRDSNVLAVGDAVSPARDPELDWFGGGWLGGRVEAQEQLLSMIDDDTRVVPSYGPVIARREVQAELDIMRVLFDRILDHVKRGMSADDIVAAGVMDGLGRVFDDPSKFMYDAYKGYWAHHNSLAPEIL